MKKLIAMLLSLAMLLSACAFAEEAPVSHSHRLSDLYIGSGEQIIDLSSLELELEVTGGEKTDAGCLRLISDGEAVAELGVAVKDGLLVCHLDSDTQGHVDFVLNPVDFLANYLDQGIEALTALLQQADTTAMAEGILNALSGAGKAPESEPEVEEALPQEQQPAPALPDFAIKGDVMAVLKGCVSEPETVDMGGVEYGSNGQELIIADGTYTSQEITIDTDTLCEILDMLYVNGEPCGLSDKLRESGIVYELHASSQKGTAEGLNEMISIDAKLGVDDQEFSVTASANTAHTEDGTITAVSYSGSMDGQAFGVSFNYSTGAVGDEAFTSDSIDMDSAVDLSELDNAEALSELGKGLSTLGTDAMNALLGPLMGAIYASVDMSALEAAEVPAE